MCYSDMNKLDVTELTTFLNSDNIVIPIEIEPGVKSPIVGKITSKMFNAHDGEKSLIVCIQE
ncbi:hypothetical protein R50345_12195 [Paenibacillus sp. FSL R5-0345]|uniref:Uncharacterized protein n=2 Tax=Paenibacillus TaxID=44249 RepID=A0A1R0Y6R9_9BACL|nr:hypothetical protein R50345_12195 [Paenibacillus sp. FSL R5-0345]OMD43046.1 hypothetical protein BSK52_05975 [Paenibacillus odorifer]